MLGENLRAFRKAQGLSQQDLAASLHVVRQTVSKWEQGLSSPDADMLLRLSAVLGTSVGILIGEPELPASDSLKTGAGRQVRTDASLTLRRKRTLADLFLLLFTATCASLVFFWALGSPYLGWDYTNPERAAAGVMFHAIEWVCVRMAPIVLIGSAAGGFLLLRSGGTGK